MAAAPWLTVRQSRVRDRWQTLRNVSKQRTAMKLERAIDEWFAMAAITTTGVVGGLREHLGLTEEQYRNWTQGRGLPDGWTPPTREGNGMTETTTATAAVKADGNGFIDLSSMRDTYEHLETLYVKRRLLDEAIAATEAKFKAAMEAAGATGFTVDGLPRRTYKADGTFAAKAFADSNPTLYAAYMTTKPVFDLEAFKQHHPELYAQFRAKRFVAVTGRKS